MQYYDLPEAAAVIFFGQQAVGGPAGGVGSAFGDQSTIPVFPGAHLR